MDASGPAFPPVIGEGEAVPWFTAPTLGGRADYVFDTVAGRAVLMLFFGSASQTRCAAAIGHVLAKRRLFDDINACFFGITVDPSDVDQARIRRQLPGIRYFLDHDGEISRRFGAAASDGSGRYRPYWLLIDRTLRVLRHFALDDGAAAVAALEAAASAPDPYWAPVLQIERVFEPEFCGLLIDHYREQGGRDSGFMRDVGGKTRLVMDAKHKVRRDVLIEDQKLKNQLQLRIGRRLLPMIRRAFQFEVTRMERYLLGCYDAEEGGHFNPHRDDTTKGTAHRRFAVTINLNAEDYEGGDLRFPEFGARTYRAPTGGAIVFSCSLLHQALPVTRGRRFAFLPFLYDEAAARLREQNNPHLDETLAPYSATDVKAGSS